MVVIGLSYYMLHNCLQTEATELAPTARGSAVALFACGFFLGQALGPSSSAAWHTRPAFRRRSSPRSSGWLCWARWSSAKWSSERGWLPGLASAAPLSA
jgi:hypothetical protein